MFEKGGGIEQKDNIAEVFETMAEVVCAELEQIIAADAEAQEDQRAANYTDFVQDFLSEDFKKNIRVRPLSGYTQNEREEVSRGMVQTENEEGEEQDNKLANIELEEQRRTIKQRQKEKDDEARRKKALAEREAEKKREKK